MTMDPKEFAKQYLANLSEIFSRLSLDEIAGVIEVIESAHEAGKQIFIIGNGGSAATASHMMSDLNKSTIGHKGDAEWPRFRAMALNDNVSMMTAWSNDTDFSQVFSGPLRNFATSGDVLVAISASGNSPNILSAVKVAKELGVKVIGLTGFGGGKLKQLADVSFDVPSNEYGPVEDVHMILDHILTSYLYKSLSAKYGTK